MGVEVGSWKGLSTCTLGRILKTMPSFETPTVIAVDTWLGAPEFWTWGLYDESRGVALRHHLGYPTIFHTFCNNVLKEQLHDVIAPLPLSSTCAAHVLQHHGVSADVIYVDAAHEYESVMQDIRTYWKLLKPGGTMMGDDYCDDWPGVTTAVDEYFGRGNFELKGRVWSARKASEPN